MPTMLQYISGWLLERNRAIGTADCTTVVILLGNRQWPCGLGMNRQFT